MPNPTTGPLIPFLLARFAATIILYAVLTTACAAEPLALLEEASPALFQLHQMYPSYHKRFAEYANQQDFRRPVENLATVVHEIIHIDSLVHQGYFIDGTYYEPYLRRDAWPTLTNEHVGPHFAGQERGAIFRLYARNTPHNHLGNIADEINAYGHVLPFVCRNEPESSDKQVTNLIGFLHLAEAYLRTLRTLQPGEYQEFLTQREGPGAFVLIVHRAWIALRQCGIPDAAIPTAETAHFISMRPGSAH